MANVKTNSKGEDLLQRAIRFIEEHPETHNQPGGPDAFRWPIEFCESLRGRLGAAWTAAQAPFH